MRSFDSRVVRIWGTLAVAAIGLLVYGCASTETFPPTGGSPQALYPVPYGRPTTQSVIDAMERVRRRLDSSVRMGVVEATSRPIGGGTAVKIMILDSGSEHKFMPVQYPMGVAYTGMLTAAEATGDPAFNEFVAKRFEKLHDFLAMGASGGATTRPFRSLLYPASLDDCGAMTAAMVKARRNGVGPDMMDTIQRSADYVSHKQFRLQDGTLARKRPVYNTVWGDDMYMSVSLLAQMGALTGDNSYFDDACKQVLQIGGHLWVSNMNLVTHGWSEENPDFQPNFFWGRANGWCMMAMAELLEVLPQDHPKRDDVLRMFRAMAKGVASQQSGTGLWHNMLDRNDSFLETSASAMFTFAMARGVSRGWLNPTTFGPVAEAGWNGLSTRIDGDGRLSGVCIGTGIGDDYVFYYARPAVDDVHGYGPVLLAGSAIIDMLKSKSYTIQATTRASGSVMFVPKGEKPQ